MKWIAGVLLVLNAGLFLWAHGHRPASTEFIRPTVNGETMILLSELAPPIAARAGAQAAGEAEGEPASPPLCFRIGPFYDVALAEGTGRRLEDLSLPFESRTVKSRTIRMYRVYLGPFDDREELNAEVAKLKDKGIRDHYIKREAGHPDIISLGLFSQNTGAEAMTHLLSEKSVTAKTRVEDKAIDPTYWLELRDSKANRAARDELTGTDWGGGDPRTKLSEFPCARS